MTDTIETPAGTELAQVAPGVLAAVRGGQSFTIADLAEKLAKPAAAPEAAPAAKAAKVVKITDTVMAALRRIPDIFGTIHPSTSRKLATTELKDLTEEAVAISTITKPLGARAKVISEIVRHHMDYVAQDQGLVDPETLRIAKGVAAGHYLVAEAEKPFTVQADGFEEPWKQVYVSGGITVNGGLLPEMEKAGTITHAEYMACTREVRIFDGDKLAALIKRDPQRGLQILQALTEQGEPTASLYQPTK